jgi:hypothetical protein
LLIKNITGFGIIIFLSLILMVGCTNNSMFGSPENEPDVLGLVVTPGQCFANQNLNPQDLTTNPLPNAQVHFYGSESGKLEQVGSTSTNGTVVGDKLSSSGYLIFAFREYPEGSKQFVILKKAVVNGLSQGISNIGEINSYTTAQVIIWEQANLLYGKNFIPFNPIDQSWSFIPSNLILPVSEINNLIPNDKLLNSVEVALQECRDPQKDSSVIKYAKEIAKANFGSPEPTPQSTPVIIYPTPCIAPLPDVKFSLTVDGYTVTFKNLSTKASRYIWDYGDGKKSITLAPSHSHTYKTAGSYLVTLTAYNICGNSISTAQMIDNVGEVSNLENNSAGMGISY